jgi:Hypothetical glycosyl hydrolase family 15
MRTGSRLALACAIVLLGVLAPRSGAATIPDDRGSLMPQVPSGIGVGLTMNYDIVDKSSEIGKIDYVWGAYAPPEPADVYNTVYIKYARDQQEVHDEAWWKEHHPTWIEYKCNKLKPAYQYGHKNMPLDITNPEVRAYQWQEEIEPRLAEGFEGPAFDNLELENESRRCGHFDASGQWVKQFTGKSGDPAFTQAVMEWVAYTRAEVHAYSATATVSMNFSYDPRATAAQNMALMEYGDLVFDERGVTNYGQLGNDRPTPALWRQIYESALALQAGGSCYDLNNEFPGASSAISSGELEWAISNYLLIKGACTYISISGFRGKKYNQQDYGVLHWYPQYERPIGEPTGAPAEQPSGAYLREFTGGLALVNPTLAAAEVILPVGVWYDGQGDAVSGSTVLAAQQGEVLTSSP